MARRFTRKRWRRPQRLTLEGPVVVRRKDLVVPDVLTLEPALAWRENRRRMGLLLVAFLTMAGIVGLIIGAVAGIVLVAVPVFAGLAFAYLVAGARFGDGWIRGVLRAEPLSDPRAGNMLEGVARRAGVPVPGLYVAPGEIPNALAGGLRRRWIVLSAGAVQAPRLELEALLAHEIAHLRDGDAAFASAYVLLGGAMELGTRALGHPGGILALLAVPLWPVCLAIRAARQALFSDDRERRADVVGALLTVYPPGMAKALRAAAGEQQPARLRATDPFWFVPRAGDPGEGIQVRARLVAEM